MGLDHTRCSTEYHVQIHIDAQQAAQRQIDYQSNAAAHVRIDSVVDISHSAECLVGECKYLCNGECGAILLYVDELLLVVWTDDGIAFFIEESVDSHPQCGQHLQTI